MNDHDEFWGDVPDWTVDEPRPRRWSGIAERRRAITDRLTAIRRDPRPADAADQARAGGGADDIRRPVTADEPLGRDPEMHAELDVDIDAAPIDARHDRHDRPAGVDPLLARFGAGAVVLTLMVPLAVNMTSNDGIDETVAAGGAAAATEVAEPVTDEATAASVEQATSADANTDATSGSTATYLDPADLPPAIPVADAVGTDDEPDLAARSTDTDGTVGTDDAIDLADATSADGEIRSSADVDDQADRLRVPCPIDFTVRPGDFWIGLADAAGIDLADLLDANQATVDTPLYPGTDICLPTGATTPVATFATADDGNGASGSTATTTASTQPATTQPATTTSTTTTTTTTTTAPPAPVGADEVISIIREVWPDDLEERALEIAYRESRYVPTAKNFCCYGVFQIYWSVHQSWLGDIGITSAEQLYDPETNARAAYALYQRAGGWGPWAL